MQLIRVYGGFMKEIILDTLLDTIKLIPFLLITFIIIEYIEHRLKNQSIIKKSGKFGPFIGGLLGTVPQCGFSASATNLYITRIITLGTLISVYLSTSDEMLPIMLAKQVNNIVIIKILCIKVLIGMTMGFLVDLLFKSKRKSVEIKDLCEHDHCHCDEGILVPSIKHTLNITLFILIITFILNLSFSYLGEELISKIFLKNNIFSSFISSLVGLIPNCGASIMITELYLSGSITFGSAMSGLLTGSGIGILILFKNNKNLKENIFILLLIYFIGAFSGVIIDLIGITI